MAVFDPRECDAARLCLSQGNPQAAARLLLKSAHRDHKAVHRLLLECSAALAAQAREAFRQGEWTVAEDALALAGRCAELTGDALVLQRQIARARQETMVLPPRSAPVCDRNTPVGLRGRALIVAAPLVTLGSVRNPAAHIPLMGRLHREHASISRLDGKYWLARAPHHEDLVAVNGAAIRGPFALRSGDRILLGAHDGRGQCELTFLLPDPVSATAVLRQERRWTVTPSGDAFDRIVLLDDYLTVGWGDRDHIRSPRLACPEVRLTWTKAGLAASAAGGNVYRETPTGEWDDPPLPLCLPCRLFVSGDEGLAEQIFRDFQTGAAVDERLDLFDPRQRA